MRFPHLFLLCVTLLTACQADPPDAGTEGHACPHYWTCNEGLECNAQDVCVPCGGPGQDCCQIPGGPRVCSEGLACESHGEGDVCQGDCGLPGKACCPDAFSGGTCNGGGACNFASGVCDGAPSDPCFSGKQAFAVAVLDSQCSSMEVIFMTDTLEQAETCRQKQLVDGAAPGTEVCAIGVTPTDTTVCKSSSSNGNASLQIPNCSDSQLALCEANDCLDGCTWSAGSCP